MPDTKIFPCHYTRPGFVLPVIRPGANEPGMDCCAKYWHYINHVGSAHHPIAIGIKNIAGEGDTIRIMYRIVVLADPVVGAGFTPALYLVRLGQGAGQG